MSMSLAYADEAIRIRQLAPLTERYIARATGAGVSTVSAWLHRTRAPPALLLRNGARAPCAGQDEGM
jgi:transcriptional regulator with XRE-family HTH domain